MTQEEKMQILREQDIEERKKAKLKKLDELEEAGYYCNLKNINIGGF
jgi:hypothetical protein